MPNSSGARQPNGIYNPNGTFQKTVRRIIQVAGVASYATNGIPVDASAYFSKIVSVKVNRQFTTATLLAPGSGAWLAASAIEVGTDTFASAKFRLALGRSLLTPAGTVAAPVFTGSALGGGHSCGAVGCDSSHPSTTTVPAGTCSAPAFTGTAAAFGMAELGVGSGSSSSITYELEVEGVPA